MRRGLLSLLIPVFLCGPAYGQVDSGSKQMQTGITPADSSRPIAVDTHQMAIAPAIIADHVTKPEVTAEPVAAASGSYPVYWLAVVGILGLILGAFGYKLIFRKRKDAAIESLAAESDSTDNSETRMRLKLENEELHAQNTRLMADNEQLKQDHARLEQLLHAANNGSDISDKGLAEEIIFYMPQPNMNGKFQEASRRTDAGNALYAFRVQADRPGIASFEFIAKDAYLNAAIGNEPSWIAIACDRTNQPSAATTKVKTDIPGTAQLQDGEWEITRKARITYL